MSKCNCIPGIHVCEWCGPMKLQYDNQAREMIAAPASMVEQLRPVRPTLDKLVQEFSTPGPANSYQTQQVKASLPTVFSISAPMSGLSLGGIVPFNVMAFLVPYDKLAFLQNDARLMDLSRVLNSSCAMGGFQGYPGIDSYWLMRPGEVINFARPMTGVAGFWIAPWSGTLPLGNTDGSNDQARFVNTIINNFSTSQSLSKAAGAGTSAFGDNGGDANVFMSGPIFAPQFRVHYTQCQTLHVPVHKAPWVMPSVQLIKPNAAVCIPPGAKTMTVAFRGGVGSNAVPSWQNNFALTPYAPDLMMQVGKGSRVAAGSWEIWVDWYGFGGQVHRHPSDYFNPSGRGYVTPDHDIEVFDIPRVACGVNFYWAGNNPPNPNYNVNATTLSFAGGD